MKLREMKLEDVAQMVQWEQDNNPLFDDYNFPPFDKRQQRLWYNSKTNYGKKCFIIEEERIQGYIAIRKINPLKKSAEMGIILRPQARDKGIGTKGIKQMLHWYFGELGYKRLSLLVGFYNQRAMNCYAKLGFQSVGRKFLTFENDAVRLTDPRYQELLPYFRANREKIQALYSKMEITKDDWQDETGSTVI